MDEPKEKLNTENPQIEQPASEDMKAREILAKARELREKAQTVEDAQELNKLYQEVGEIYEEEKMEGRYPEKFLNEVFDWIEKNPQDPNNPLKKDAWGWRFSEDEKLVDMYMIPGSLPDKFVDKVENNEPVEFKGKQNLKTLNGVGIDSLIKNLKGKRIISTKAPRTIFGDRDEESWYLKIIENGTESAAEKFPIWKTIKLGTSPKSGMELESEMWHDISIDFRASEMLRNRDFGKTASKTETIANLVKITGKDLGFEQKKEIPFEQIRIAAFKKGLQLCPAETGPKLRMEYNDQPDGESLLIAMNEILDEDNNPRIFIVEKNKAHGLTFRSNPAYANSPFLPDDEWIFIQPEKKEK